MKTIYNSILFALLCNYGVAQAATITVISSSDASLRGAITQANDGDIIQIPSGVIYLTAPLNITKNLTLSGTGTSLVALDGNSSHRVIAFSGNTLALNNLQIQNGSNNDGLGGAGLLIQSGTVTISNSTFTGNNDVTGGGAIYNNGNLTINRSTLFNNQSPTGAAILVGSASNLAIYYSTLVNNVASAGGAITNDGMLTTEGSIFYNPTDCSGTGIINSTGYNLQSGQTCTLLNNSLAPDYFNIQTSPVASTLSNAGKTQILVPDSAQSSIIDKAPSTCSGVDQIGTSVPQNIRCDIGAVEVIVASTTTPTNNVNQGDDDEHENEDDDDGEGSSGTGSFNPVFFTLLLLLQLALKRTKQFKL